MSRVTIADIAQKEALQKAYAEWQELPFTKLVRGAAELLTIPPGLPVASRVGESALYYAGMVDGRHELYRRVFQLPDVVEEQKQLIRIQKLVPDYGADAMLKKEEEG